MDANMIMTMIGSLGFPIVACGAMAYYVKYSSDKAREQIDAIIQRHQEDLDSLKEALNNNTLAIQKLSDYIERDEKD